MVKPVDPRSTLFEPLHQAGHGRTAAPAPGVAVIIGAYNARDTIARAVASALDQPEVGEVIVVDDASSDDSAAVAMAADDGSGRLIVLRQRTNGGPAAARNIAIARSSAPYVAVLDADDFLLPGRFAALFEQADWDLIADNIVFVRENKVDGFSPEAIHPFYERSAPLERLDLSGFIERNISSRSAPRGELGFLKVVMRRAFLDQEGLRYDETLRLGEDYILYCQALAAGARFRLSRHCGYVAIERGASLSGNHRTEDLFALAAADTRLIEAARLSPAEGALLRGHRRQILAKARHRRFLDDRRRVGIVRATLNFADRPGALFRIARDILLDKIAHFRPAPPSSGGPLRYLFD